MRGIDIFCASQAATAICLSMEEGSSSSSSTIHLGSSRTIDRHNPIIRDAKRIGKSLTTPCSSQPPISPKPHTHHQRRHHRPRQTSKLGGDRKSKRESAEPVSHHDNTDKITGKSSGKAGDHFISPPASSRYLLSDGAFLDVLSDFDPVLALVPVEPTKSQAHIKPDDPSSAPKPPYSSRSTNQVVVLRVSLHCKGCAGKVRKHISRMRGVTSFDIDFAAKKVTVVGDVTPLEVLASVSKVKNAQLWTPAMSASAVPVGSSYEEIKKHEA